MADRFLNSDGGATLRGSSARNLAIFIDADNLNDATALDHVLIAARNLADRIVYRRAYGRAESLRAIESVLWRHGVRPVANLIVDKTTTDSALVIDAVEAVCRNDVDVVAICSGDADFVPLAMWLRERQCRVLCYSLSSKIFANPESFYDDVVLIDVVSDMAPLAEEIQPESTTTSAVPPTKKLRTLVTSEPAREPTVKMLLETLPELRTGQSLHLSVAARRLREAGLLSKTAASTSLFKRYPAQFQLTPSQKPNNVRYRG